VAEQKRAVLIRCCANDYEDALEQFDTLSAFTSDVYLVYSGEESPTAVPPRIAARLILVNEAFLRRAELYSPRLPLARLSWQCGDVALYAAYEAVQADYFWMIEPDVYATPAILRKLFSTPLAHDFYAATFRREHAHWFWYPSAATYFAEVWACIFCIVGIRRSALPALRAARSKMLQAWSLTSDIPRAMPNDEGFVCSSLRANGGSCADINELFALYTKRTIGFGMPRSRKALMLGRGPGEFLYHPIYTGSTFARKVQQRLTDHGLGYGSAFEMLVEQNVLPIAPIVDSVVTLGYLAFVQPRATWRRASLRLLGVKLRLSRLLSQRLPRSVEKVATR
jgi:hypothetical protein